VVVRGCGGAVANGEGGLMCCGCAAACVGGATWDLVSGCFALPHRIA